MLAKLAADASSAFPLALLENPRNILNIKRAARQECVNLTLSQSLGVHGFVPVSWLCRATYG